VDLGNTRDMVYFNNMPCPVDGRSNRRRYLKGGLPAGGRDQVVGSSHSRCPGDVVYGVVVLAQLTLLQQQYATTRKSPNSRLKESLLSAVRNTYLLQCVLL
jgi:hypothetical protein